MITVYIYDTSELEDERLFEREYIKMPLYRREKTDKYKPMLSKRQSLGAGILTNIFLEEYGLTASDITFSEEGKPLIKKEAGDAAFSLSHAGKYAAIAYGRGSIGIDIEGVDHFRRFLPEMIYSERELSYIKNCPKEEGYEEACKIWVAKEAVTKAKGSGIADMTGSFDVLGRDGKIAETILMDGGKRAFNCRPVKDPPEGYFCS